MEIFTHLFATLAKLFATLAIIKSLHFLIEIHWLIKKGNTFADDIERAIISNDLDLLESLVRENREKTHILIYKIIRSKTKVGKIMGNFFYRMPVLLFFTCISGYFSDKETVKFLGFIVFACTLVQVAYLITSRFILGIADNYYHPVQYVSSSKDAKYATKWSQRQILQSFLTRFIIIFMSVVFSMGFVHFSVEEIFPGHDYNINQQVPDIFRYTYFSLVIITTTGFGDIFPNSIYAMIVTATEITFNLVFFVVLLFSVSLTFHQS